MTPSVSLPVQGNMRGRRSNSIAYCVIGALVAEKRHERAVLPWDETALFLGMSRSCSRSASGRKGLPVRGKILRSGGSVQKTTRALPAGVNQLNTGSSHARYP
jgi:hypothetical protein